MPDTPYTYRVALPPARMTTFAVKRIALAKNAGLYLTFQIDYETGYIKQTIHADDEAALTFFLLSVPTESH